MKNVGGQAVLEGVMMRGSSNVATSVRTSDGSIVTKTEPLSYKKGSLYRTPILRGIINLIDSMIVGVRVMNYSASLFETEDEAEEEDSKFFRWLNKVTSGNADKVMSYFSVIFSFIIAILLFTVLPTYLAGLFRKFSLSKGGINLVEAGIKILFFMIYLIGISRIPEIDRVFRYHGAEHKVIAAYENDLDLTVENVRKSSRYHARCGTNFLFLVLMVSIAVYSLIPFRSAGLRVISKLLLVPVVAGVTYELIRWLGSNDSRLSKIISAPGKLLQKITTKEPDDSMIEVAITALKTSEGIPWTIKELTDYADSRLKGLETPALDRDVLLSHITGYDRAYLLSHREMEVSNEKFEEFKKAVNERRKHKPVSYITGRKEFMGLEFTVDENTLIPRPDTEILVESALAGIKGYINRTGINDPELLDMCSGSGAIGISILKNIESSHMTFADLSQKVMDICRKNAEDLGVSDRASFVVTDLFRDLKTDRDFDFIFSNPPYIRSEEIGNLPRDVREWEPKMSLDGGGDGLDFYRKISDKARKYLKDGGMIYFEIGYDQKDDVIRILRDFNYSDIESHSDLSGKDRVVSAAYIHDL